MLGFLVCSVCSKEHSWVNLYALKPFAHLDLEPPLMTYGWPDLNGWDAVFICGNFKSSREVLEVDKMRLLSEGKNNQPIRNGAGKQAVVQLQRVYKLRLRTFIFI